ncbi:MAG: NAD(P)-dependent oxidoreductase [Opitutus sp.]
MNQDRSDASPGLVLPFCPEDVDEFLGRPGDGARRTLERYRGPFLVLGAGGKIGLHVCIMLRRALDSLGRKDEVIAVSRFQLLRDQSEFTRHGIPVLACDLTDPTALAALPDAPVVFFLAGVKFGTSTAPDLLEKLNVIMPRMVAKRFRKSQIVAFSTGCVYPFVSPESGGATEDTPLGPVGEYAASCVAREEAFRAVSAEHGTPVTLLRLNYSVEFRYGILVDIARKVLEGTPIDVTTGHVNVIWQRDAVEHTIQALDLAASPAVPINITGPAVLAVRDVARAYGELLQRPVTLTGREAPTAWLNNAARSHRLFGPPPTPLEDMMKWTAAWLTGGGATWGKPTGFDRRDGQF